MEEEPSFAAERRAHHRCIHRYGGQARTAAPSAPPPAAPKIDPDMRVGEILTTWPQTVDVFVGHGFASLANPEHREQVKQIPITLRMACQRHNVDLDYMVSELNEAILPSSAAGSRSPNRRFRRFGG